MKKLAEIRQYYLANPPELKMYSVIVNGKVKTVESQTISFSDVLKLAYDDPQRRKDYLTVTYRDSSSSNKECRRSGMMTLGGEIKIDEGMVFDVADTSGA